MKFLITGINGFAGRHLAKLLIEEGHEVHGLAKNVTNANANVNVYIYGDLTNPATADLVFNQTPQCAYNGVFHLAALTHPPTSFEKPAEYFNVNAMATIYMCEALRKYQPGCVLMYCSTSEIYGINPEGAIISEKTRVKPSNPYAVSKAAGDLYCKERFKNKFLKGFITRAFSHTGPGRPANYSISSDAIQIAKIIKGIQKPEIRIGNLDCKRTVMDVRDTVDVYYQLMMKYIERGKAMVPVDGDIFNIAGNDLCRIGYFLDLMILQFNLGHLKIKRIIDEKLYRKIDIPVQYPDASRVRKFLGWKPKIRIEQTIKDLVNYWLERV